MKLHKDLDIVLIIMYLNEEVPDLKVFIKPFIRKGGDCLVGHTKTQQFRFYMCDDDIPTMQFSKLGLKGWNINLAPS